MSFSINRGKGFSVKFKNGWIVSVQFGAANYCDNYSDDCDAPQHQPLYKCNNAEYAVINSKGNFVELPEFMGEDSAGNEVSNKSNASQVLELMNWAAKQ